MTIYTHILNPKKFLFSFWFHSPLHIFIFEKSYSWKQLLFSIQTSIWSEKEDYCTLHHESGKGNKLLYNWIYFHNTVLGTSNYLTCEEAALESHWARGHPLLILVPGVEDKNPEMAGETTFREQKVVKILAIEWRGKSELFLRGSYKIPLLAEGFLQQGQIVICQKLTRENNCGYTKQ